LKLTNTLNSKKMNIKSANKSPLAKSKSVSLLPQPTFTATGMGKKPPVAVTASKKGSTLKVVNLIENKGVTSSAQNNTDQELKKRGKFFENNLLK
jgi:hypothetical protein